MQQEQYQQGSPSSYDQEGIHHRLGLLARQLHDSLRELGYADSLRGSVEALPDAQNRLTYIARLTGEAAEKVLTLVDEAKERQTTIVERTKHMRQAMIADPVAAVAKGGIMNYLEEMEHSTEIVDQQLTDIMMAQNFHDLTGQVIAKVVNLASGLEQQLLQLLLQTAPTGSAAASAAAFTSLPEPEPPKHASSSPTPSATPPNSAASNNNIGISQEHHPSLDGPVIAPQEEEPGAVVTSQSEVDDLLASLGF